MWQTDHNNLLGSAKHEIKPDWLTISANNIVIIPFKLIQIIIKMKYKIYVEKKERKKNEIENELINDFNYFQVDSTEKTSKIYKKFINFLSLALRYFTCYT